MAGKTVAGAVSNFGASAKAKLSNVAITGAPEDQLRGPLDTLLHDLAEIGGLPPKAINLVGETTLKHLKTRPDYAVTVSNALVGFIEVKAPGKGADARRSEAHMFGDMGCRLFARRTSAQRADAHISGGAATRLHRSRRSETRRLHRGARSGALSQFAEGFARGEVRRP